MLNKILNPSYIFLLCTLHLVSLLPILYNYIVPIVKCSKIQPIGCQGCFNKLFIYFYLSKYRVSSREDEGRERIPHTWASSDENYLKSIFGSVSYCVVILRTALHWSVRMLSCNVRLLTYEQQIKNNLRSLGAN